MRGEAEIGKHRLSEREKNTVRRERLINEYWALICTLDP